MIQVRELTLTCPAWPSQWEGRTSDGEYVYVRYRNCHLSIGAGATLTDAVLGDDWLRRPVEEQSKTPGRTLLDVILDRGYMDGEMTGPELLELTKEIIDWGPVEAQLLTGPTANLKPRGRVEER